MNRNVKIARELVKLAKNLVAGEALEKVYNKRIVNDVAIGFAEFTLAIASDEDRQNSQALKILYSTLDKIADMANRMGLPDDDIEFEKFGWYDKENRRYHLDIRFVYHHGDIHDNRYGEAHGELVAKVVRRTQELLRKEGFVFNRNA